MTRRILALAAVALLAALGCRQDIDLRERPGFNPANNSPGTPWPGGGGPGDLRHR